MAGTRSKQGADDDAGQHQHERDVARADRGSNQVDQCHRDEPAAESERLYGEDAEREEDAGHGAQGRTRGCAENVGRYQRITEKALKGGPRDGESRAAQDSCQHPRAPDIEDHGIDGGRQPRRLPDQR
jgi:hypothetical protein